VLSGQGELWRSVGGTEEVVALEGGVCVDIPLPVDFQFRSIGPAPLDLLLLTTPPWPDDMVEAVPASSHRWTATAVSTTRSEL
jgi:mannose-6-phosphate isomerase-like protein (cupin superfamily)